MIRREEIVADAEKYKQIKAEIKRMTAQAETLKDRIVQYMDENKNDRITGDTVTAVRYIQHRNYLDTKSLELDHPDLVASYRYEKTIVGLKVI